MSCLIAWWQEAGCTLNGHWSPTVDADMVELWNGMGVDSVEDDMLYFFQEAADGYVWYVSACLGN